MHHPNNPYQQQPSPMGQPQQGYGQPQQGYGYEFRESENEVLRKAGNAAKFLGVVFFIQAAFQLPNLNLIGLAINIALGVSFFQGGKSLQNVVETQGNDIAHLMEGLEKLSSAFLIRLVIVGIAFGLIALIMLGAMLIALA